MAIARLSMKVGKAGKAGPHAAYIAREGQYAGRLERGERLAATEAGNMPAWAQAEPGQFWQAADAHERSNGTTYREMEIALPRELSTDQQVELVRDWVKQELGDKHAYQWAIHVPTAADGGEQPHVHLMFSERQRDGIERDPEQYFKRYNAKAPEKGGARKGYGPDAGKTKTKGERAEELKALRGRWEAACNLALERAGSLERIDMRSLAEQGRGEQPEPKQLPSQWRGEGKGNVIEFRAAKRAAVEARREVVQVIPALVVDLAKERQARKERQEQGERIEAVRNADPARRDLAAVVRQELAGQPDDALLRIERETREAAQIAQQQAAKQANTDDHGHPIRVASRDAHHARQAFEQAEADLEHYRKAHPIKAALLGSSFDRQHKALEDRAIAALKRWEKAEDAKEKTEAEQGRLLTEKSEKSDALKLREKAVGALRAERQAEADALDPKAAQRRQEAAQAAEKRRQEVNAEIQRKIEQSRRDRGRGR